MPDDYSVDAIRASLKTIMLGRRVEMHQWVGSTNDVAREAARRGEEEGLVVLAEEQVTGRGRLGRVWLAPPGCCILCSVLLRPRFSPERGFYITIATALAIYRACKALLMQYGRVGTSTLSTRPELGIAQEPAVAIKWPNDVLIGGRKVSGVLCESELDGRDWACCVAGFGINVNLSVDEIAPLQSRATSLAVESGRSVDRTQLLAQVLIELEGLYFSLQNGQFGVVHDEWVAALETIGKRVSVRKQGGVIEGEALRVDADGALVVRLATGEERRVVEGDVTA